MLWLLTIIIQFTIFTFFSKCTLLSRIINITTDFNWQWCWLFFGKGVKLYFRLTFLFFFFSSAEPQILFLYILVAVGTGCCHYFSYLRWKWHTRREWPAHAGNSLTLDNCLPDSSVLGVHNLRKNIFENFKILNNFK